MTKFMAYVNAAACICQAATLIWIVDKPIGALREVMALWCSMWFFYSFTALVIFYRQTRQESKKNDHR